MLTVYAECLAIGESGTVACFMLEPGNGGNEPVRWFSARR